MDLSERRLKKYLNMTIQLPIQSIAEQAVLDYIRNPKINMTINVISCNIVLWKKD